MFMEDQSCSNKTKNTYQLISKYQRFHRFATRIIITFGSGEANKDITEFIIIDWMKEKITITIMMINTCESMR